MHNTVRAASRAGVGSGLKGGDLAPRRRSKSLCANALQGGRGAEPSGACGNIGGTCATLLFAAWLCVLRSCSTHVRSDLTRGNCS